MCRCPKFLREVPEHIDEFRGTVRDGLNFGCFLFLVLLMCRCRKFLREVPEHIALQAIEEFMSSERKNIRKVSAYLMVSKLNLTVHVTPHLSCKRTRAVLGFGDTCTVFERAPTGPLMTGTADYVRMTLGAYLTVEISD